MTNDPFDLAQRPQPHQQLTVSKIALGVCLGNVLSVIVGFLMFVLLGLILAALGIALPEFLK